MAYEDDKDFLRAVETAEIKPEEFRHLAHLRYAFLCVKRDGVEAARERVCGTIQHLAKLWEVEEKFHRTTTEAMVCLIHERVKEREDWSGAEASLGDLHRDALGVLGQHYSSERLKEPQARLAFLKPDLLNFDGSKTPDIPPRS